MAKGVGIDPGEYQIKVVELDGSYRKPRLTKLRIGPVPRPADSKDSAVTQVAKAALATFDASHAARENVCLGFPLRETVLRTINVPFTGQEQIRKVIKFEVEGAIHSHQLDEMVVDFLILEEKKGETRVLVASVPKPALQTTLRTLEKGGFEPELVDLDAAALVRVAELCGVFDAPGARAKIKERDPKDARATAEERREATDAQALAAKLDVKLLVDMGARSTRVLIVSASRLIDLRAMRSGVDTIADEVAQAEGVSLEVARRAVEESLRTGDDFTPEAIPAAPAAEVPGDAEAAGAAVATVPQPISHSTVLLARDRFLDKLRKEITRFLASVRGLSRIESLFVTGGGSQLPGSYALLEEVFGVTPQPLDVLGSVSHSLSPEEAEAANPKIAVAVGLALKWLGGPAGFNFRQEELAFTRQFDRIKFPLAIAVMIAAFFMLVYGVKLWKELNVIEGDYGVVWQTAEAKPATGRAAPTKTVFTGMVGKLVNPGNWFATPTWFRADAHTDLVKKLAEAPTFNRLAVIKNALATYYTQKQKESGYYSEFRIESGFAVLARMAEIIERTAPQLGRFVIMDIDLLIPVQKEGRHLVINLMLRGSNFREKYTALEAAFEQDCKDEMSPFEKKLVSQKPETGFRNTEEEGAFMELRMKLKGEIPVFHTSQAR